MRILLAESYDGYILTAKGKSVVHMIEKIENVEVDEKLERSEKTEEILKRLNSRSVCWLLAVSERVKPAATMQRRLGWISQSTR